VSDLADDEFITIYARGLWPFVRDNAALVGDFPSRVETEEQP
jgi:hypothetical protein